MRPPTLTSSVPSDAPSREEAFTLVEVLVVLVIIAVLMALIVPRFQGARDNGRASVVMSAAQSYVDAIDAFALDRSGRMPVFGSATDWPLGTNQGASGPLQPIAAPGAPAGAPPAPYLLRSIPESAQTGRVAINATGASTAAFDGTLVYRTNGGATPTEYALEVWVKKADGTYPAAMRCYYGNMTVSGAKKCS